MNMNKSIFSAVFVAVLFSLMTCTCITVACAAEKAAVPSATTRDNLITACKGEQNAHARYMAFANKANEEGYDAAASLFKAAALAEKIHYERHAKIIKKLGGTPVTVIETLVVKSTPENIKAAFAAETYEKDIMYPAFLKQAERDNIKDAVEAFEDARAAEGSHAKLYGGMLKNLDLSKGLAKDFYVCPVCGNVVDAITSSKCPICFTETKKFVKVK